MISANAQQGLWQSLPLDFNDIYLSNTSGPEVMYYDSVADASYIAGTFQKIGGTLCNVVELDENGFTLLPPSPLPYTYDVARYHGKLYFSGPGLATWDGLTWALLDSVNDVGKLMIHNDSLWALVSLHSDSGNITTVATWKNDSWINMYHADTIIGEWTPYDLTFYKNELYIAGNINNIQHLEINEIARFDGTRWRDVGNFQDGSLDDVRKLLVWQDTLYVAGAFEEANGSPGNGIAKWDGHNWHRLNDGVWQNGGPAITDIKVFNNELYACGWFYWVDGIQQGLGFHGFAKWDGNRWCTLGTTANNVPFTMGLFKDSLFLMGGFDSLNNQPMRYMAKWIGGDYTDSCSRPDTTTGITYQPVLATKSLSVFPNPATGWLNIQYDAPMAAATEPLAQISILDLTGRLIQAKSVKIFKRDNHFRLNTTGLSPGMYFLEISNGKTRRTVKFVKR